MSEQNRRAVEGQGTPGDDAARHGDRPENHRSPPNGPKALSPEADERQTRRQAPSTAAPGESSQDDGIG